MCPDELGNDLRQIRAEISEFLLAPSREETARTGSVRASLLFQRHSHTLACLHLQSILLSRIYKLMSRLSTVS